MAAFFVFFYYASCNFPMRLDDYTYKYVFLTDRLVSDIGDVIESQVNHYKTWGGRFVAHSLVQTFLMLDRDVFALFNVWCYSICCFCLAFWGGKERKMSFYLVVLLSFWLLMPNPSSSMFWLTGCCNYLWSFALTSLFLFLLFSENKYCRILALLVGVIAGNGHESVSAAISSALVLYALFSPKKSNWFYVGIIAYVVGMLTNVIAPGNYVRLEREGIGEQLPIVIRYVKNALKVGFRLTFNVSHPGVQICTSLWLISAFVCVSKLRKKRKEFVLPLCFVIGALCSLALNVVSGVSGPTSVAGFCLASYIGMMCIFHLTNMSRYLVTILLCLVAMNMYMVPWACCDIAIMKENVTNAEDACRKGVTVVRATPKWERLQDSNFAHSAVNSCSLRNQALERYMGVTDISMLGEKEYCVIDANRRELSQMKIHEFAMLDECVEIAKLECRPESLHMNVELTEAPYHSSFSEKVMLRLNKFRKHKNECSLICLDNVYYLYWINKNANKVTIRIKYPGKDEVMIQN